MKPNEKPWFHLCLEHLTYLEGSKRARKPVRDGNQIVKEAVKYCEDLNFYDNIYWELQLKEVLRTTKPIFTSVCCCETPKYFSKHAYETDEKIKVIGICLKCYVSKAFHPINGELIV